VDKAEDASASALIESFMMAFLNQLFRRDPTHKTAGTTSKRFRQMAEHETGMPNDYRRREPLRKNLVQQQQRLPLVRAMRARRRIGRSKREPLLRKPRSNRGDWV